MSNPPPNPPTRYDLLWDTLNRTLWPNSLSVFHGPIFWDHFILFNQVTRNFATSQVIPRRTTTTLRCAGEGNCRYHSPHVYTTTLLHICHVCFPCHVTCRYEPLLLRLQWQMSRSQNTRMHYIPSRALAAKYIPTVVKGKINWILSNPAMYPWIELHKQNNSGDLLITPAKKGHP